MFVFLLYTVFEELRVASVEKCLLVFFCSFLYAFVAPATPYPHPIYVYFLVGFLDVSKKKEGFDLCLKDKAEPFGSNRRH